MAGKRGRVSPWSAFVTTALASAVEMVEMVTIVVGVGAIRGWRPTLIGVVAGFAVLAVLALGAGAGLTQIPIDVLRAVVGALLLIFGLQWLVKGVRRVSAKGLAGDDEDEDVQARGDEESGLDWTAFVLSFKGVVLEGLEITFIAVSFGAAADALGYTAAGAGVALVVIGGLGIAFHRIVARVPRSLLILIVGTLLTTFGTFWAAEGLGARWPDGDASILGLLALYVGAAGLYVTLVRRRAPLVTA